MTTSLQVEANRRNALRSCGPRTPEGKAHSCLNAVKHGLTARTLILPGEDPEEFARCLAAWTADLQPCNPLEEDLVRQAVGHSWRLERADWLQVEILSERITAVPLEEARRRREEVADLGRRLLPGPSGDHVARPEPDRRAGPDDPDDPARLLSRLESTSDGCRWLLDRWAEKRRAPEAGRAWSPAEMVEAIRLLGKRPLEDLDDRRVLSVVLACSALDRQRPDPFAALWVGLTDREVQRCREWLLERGLAASMPCTPQDARAVLLEVVDDADAELRSLERHHRARDEARAALHADLLSFDDSREGESLRRHQIRATRAIVRIADRFREARRKGVALAPDLPAPAAGPLVEDESSRPGETPGHHPAAPRSDSPTPAVTSFAARVDRITRSNAPPRLSTSRGHRPKASRSPARDRARKVRRALGRSIRLVGSLAMTLLVVAATRTTDGSPPPDRPEASGSAHLAHPGDRDASPGLRSPGLAVPNRLASPATTGLQPRKRQIEPNSRPVGAVLPVVPPYGVDPEHGSRGPPGPGGDPSSVDRRSAGPPFAGALRPRAPSSFAALLSYRRKSPTIASGGAIACRPRTPPARARKPPARTQPQPARVGRLNTVAGTAGADCS